MNDNVKVSVFMLTYNQENYIGQAIEGVLSQITNFNYELVIGEDGSQDRTLDICKDYHNKFPERIKLIFNIRNIGLISNFIKTAFYLTGKYIAICDGDDYWIDQNKLQKQVDFLENNHDYSIVYAKSAKLYKNGKFKIPETQNNQNQPRNFTDLLKGNFISSVTVLFKNNIKGGNIPLWISELPYGDWPLYLQATSNGGKIYFIDEVVAVYRMEIGESFKIYRSPVRTISVELNILKRILNDPLFSNWVKDISEAILLQKVRLMNSYHSERLFFKGFVIFLNLLFSNYSGNTLIKQYLYSIYKYFYANPRPNIQK